MSTTSDRSVGPTSVIVFLQWSKQKFQFEIVVPPFRKNGSENFTGRSLMDIVYWRTKVPVERQKIVVSKSKSNSGKNIKWWKGVLWEDFDFSSALSLQGANEMGANWEPEPIQLNITLMGSAEVLAPNQKKTKFVEDMTPSEKQAEEEKETADAMSNVAAMIPALQIPPEYRQPPVNAVSMNSEYDEDRAYDRLVHGFSQLRIDALLRHQQNPRNQSLKEDAHPPPPQLLGRVAMTLGLEVQRAYVNDLAVLKRDGTLVSGLDDGHIHMWKYCQKGKDIVHESAGGIGIFDAFRGVDSVLALDNNYGTTPASFATAGRGIIRVWDSEGKPLLGRSSPLPFASPTGLIRIPVGYKAAAERDNTKVLCLAARFRVAPPPSRRPRLVPQDSAGRRRVQQIEQTESMVVEDLTKLSKSVQILYVDTAESRPNSDAPGARTGNTAGQAQPNLCSMFLNSPNPVTCMESWKDGTNTYFVVGDSLGGVMFWRISMAPPKPASTPAFGARIASALRGARSSSSNGRNENNGNNENNGGPILTCTKLKYLKIASHDDPTETRSAIACLKYVSETRQLFVSTKEIPPTTIASMTLDDEEGFRTICFPIRPAQAVHCISVDNIITKSHLDPLDYTLDGHKDVVQHILSLPNGDLLTAGGKLDATTKVWPWAKLRAATSGHTEQGESVSIASLLDASPPPVLRNASSNNIAGYVFGMELLDDHKSRSIDDDGETKNSKSQFDCKPFAIAVAQYNVVKIVI